MRRLVQAAIILSVLAGAVGYAALTRQSSYVALVPGPTFDVADVHGPDVADPAAATSTILLTTVEVRPLSWWEELTGSGPGTVVHRSVVPAAQPDLRVFGQLQLEASAAVAAELATSGAPITGRGATVGAVAAGSPAHAAGVELGDVIVAVNGRLIRSAEAGAAALEGSVSTMRVIRDGEDVELPGLSDQRPVGVALVTAVEPTGMSVKLTGVGGSSGGLALTLAFLDAAGKGSLTGGHVVAASGTIGLDGSVGAVSGVAEKARGAAAAGATVMFVPTATHAAALSAKTGVEIVAVDDYRDAVAWLCSHGATDDICR